MADASVSSPDFLRHRYDRMWSASIGNISSGTVEIDPTLARGDADRRRGMTLLFRPPAPVRRKITESLDKLRELEPGQHYYHPDEFHVTFLSLFTATEHHEAFFARTNEYAEAVAATVRRLGPFDFRFAGVTASPSAILVQGFTDAEALNAARDDLRRELQSRDLSRSLDQRYRLETAHLSVVRFREPLRKPKAFAEALQRMRAADFGHADVGALELVRNDWYMSRGVTQRLRHYPLDGPAASKAGSPGQR